MVSYRFKRFVSDNKRNLFIGGTIAIIVLIVIVLIPIIISVSYKHTSNSSKEPFDPSKLNDDEKSRINCFLEEESKFENLTRYACESRGCIYKPSNFERVPTCYFNRTKLGYRLNNKVTEGDYLLTLSNDYAKLPYIGAVETLRLSVEYLGDTIIHVKITDNTKERYEIPYKLNPPSKENETISNGLFELFEDPGTDLVSFRISRKSDNERIFDTSFGGFIYNDQFLQISTYLSTKYIYGFGENNHETLLHDTGYKTWGIFARDNAPGWGENKNLYGSHPMYLGMNENTGKSHAVLLYNSNSMEYMFTPQPSLTLRTIGGILDFYFIINDEGPKQVIEDYHKLIGLPKFPPYWSFGFQLSRWGYKNLNDVKEVIDRTRAAKLPHDVQYIDIEYMIGYRILTVDQENYAGLNDYMKEVRKDGLKLVLIVDPGLVIERNNSIYMKGLEDDIYVKWPKNMAPYDKDSLDPDQEDIISWCWPNWKLSYPDYMNDRTHNWWRVALDEFMSNETYGCDMDGLWIDMNEPSSFETNELKPWNWNFPDDQERYPYFSLKCPANRYDDPPYRTKNAFAYDSDDLLAKKARLSAKTLCMIHKHNMNGNDYFHYDVHSLYGHSQSVATYKALKEIKTNLRPFALTRSNFVGTGQYAVHWLGDNDSTWKMMKMSIIGILEYNFFGIPMVGADICGFFIEVRDVEMCTRWLQVGSFYTFTRSHNANNKLDKDPASFKDKDLEDSTRNALKIRYTLLPYLYTNFFETHNKGGAVVKPLFFEFPTDKETLKIDQQFLFGSAVLVSPVLDPGRTSVRAYFPKSVWYDYRTGAKINSTGQYFDLDAPLKIIPLHLKGGSILPTQDPLDFLNTTWTRTNPMGLIVNLDNKGGAEGEFFWDDGVSFNYSNSGKFFQSQFVFIGKKLEFKVIRNGINEITDQLKYKIL